MLPDVAHPARRVGLDATFTQNALALLMTTELITIFAAILGSVVVVGLAVVWWMNRTPTFDKDDARALPLFGSSGSSDAARLEISAWNDVDSAPSYEDGEDTASPTDGAAAQREFDTWGGQSTDALLNRLRQDAPQRDVDSWAPTPDRVTDDIVASASTPSAGTPSGTFATDPVPEVRLAEPNREPFSSFAPVQALPPVAAADLSAGFALPVRSPTELPRVESVPSSDALPRFDGQPVAPVEPIGAQATDAWSAPMRTSARPEEAIHANGSGGRKVEGQLLRFSVPADGTLQFLPGRLEISSGLDAGREIRFVRVPGPNGTEVTFGRKQGELYRHVQLLDQTVSRTHARLRFKDERWNLLNLSKTNPVVLDGKVLSTEEDHLLDDGARIEMGEVVFTFRNR